MHMIAKWTCVSIALVVLVTLGGCTYSRTLGPWDIEADDNNRLMPGGRVSYEILPRNASRRRGALLDLIQGTAPIQGAFEEGVNRRRAEFVLAAEAELSQVDGRDQYTVPDRERIELGAEIPGPTRADVKIDRLRSRINLRAGGRFLDIVSLEARIGLAVDQTEVDVQTPARSLTQDKTKAAFFFGSRLAVRPIPLFDLYAQFGYSFGDFRSFDGEIGGQLNLTRNVGFYGAYRRMTYRVKNFRGNGSDLEDKFEGPTFGANLSF